MRIERDGSEWRVIVFGESVSVRRRTRAEARATLARYRTGIRDDDIASGIVTLSHVISRETFVRFERETET